MVSTQCDSRAVLWMSKWCEVQDKRRQTAGVIMNLIRVATSAVNVKLVENKRVWWTWFPMVIVPRLYYKTTAASTFHHVNFPKQFDMVKPCVICQDTSHNVALPGRAAEDRQERRLPATDRRPVSQVELGQTRPPGRGSTVFVSVTHSHHKTSRLCVETKRCWTLAEGVQEEQGWMRCALWISQDSVLLPSPVANDSCHDMMMKVKSIHTCHSHCCWISCWMVMFSAENRNCFHFPMERFFTRRAGPLAIAWQERHVEEDFLALVRHTAATKLEMEQWPPVLKKRRVEKPPVDEQYTRTLCDRVATLVKLLETLPQAKRPEWCRQGMSPFAERGAPPDGAEAVAAVEPVTSKRAYHRQGGRLRTAAPDRGPPGGMAAACLPTFVVDADAATMAGGIRRKGTNREMLAMCSIPFCERSATVLVRQASRSPRVWCSPSSTEWPSSMTLHADSAYGGPSTSSAVRVWSIAPHQEGTRKRRNPSCCTWANSDALDALRDGVQIAPFLHHQHGRDAREPFGPRARPKHNGHRRRGQTKSHDLDGRAHDRHHHGQTHCGRRHEKIGTGPARAREDFLQLQRGAACAPRARARSWSNGLALGCDNEGSCIGCCCGIVPLSIARLLCWNGSVLLIRSATCYSFWVATQRSCNLRTSQSNSPLSTSSRASNAFFLRSPYAGTMRCVTCASAPWSVSWRRGFCTQRGGRKVKHHNEGLAPPLLDFRRGSNACGDGTLFDETEMEQEEPPEDTDLSTMIMPTATMEASEPFPTVAAQVARAERCLYLRCAYGKNHTKPWIVFHADAGPKVRLHRAVVAHVSDHDLAGSSTSFK